MQSLTDVFIVESYKEYNRMDHDLAKSISWFETRQRDSRSDESESLLDLFGTIWSIRTGSDDKHRKSPDHKEMKKYDDEEEEKEEPTQASSGCSLF